MATLYHQTTRDIAARILAEGFVGSRLGDADSRGRVWLAASPEGTTTGSERGWMIEVEVPDEVAETWQYKVSGEWLETYNPPIEDANAYPRTARPHQPD